MSFSHILFDLDGTLTNPRLGIGNSLRYALRQMHINGYSDEILKRFIGPPLQEGFRMHFGLEGQMNTLAVEHFRTYFGEKGLYENEPFEGIIELFEELHLAGKKVYVVTSKLEKYARIILQHFEFDRYVEDLQGADYSGRHSSKAELIARLMERHRLAPTSSIVMVGDTHYDILGAREQEISSIGVTYGFGTPETLLASQPDYMVDSVEELAELLLS